MLEWLTQKLFDNPVSLFAFAFGAGIIFMLDMIGSQAKAETEDDPPDDTITFDNVEDQLAYHEQRIKEINAKRREIDKDAIIKNLEIKLKDMEKMYYEIRQYHNQLPDFDSVLPPADDRPRDDSTGSNARPDRTGDANG